EILGIADRTDYDLKRHEEYSKQDMSYLDPETNERYIPYVIEPSMGLDRLVLMTLVDSYDEEALEGGDSRIVMHLSPAVAPYKIAVLPLSKKLSEKAMEILGILNKRFSCTFDETASIGKRYRRQDEIGTPYCVTIDFQTAEDQCVTIRERDSMKQIRMSILDLVDYFTVKFFY
ncbi:MAG: glycine--tRNA ligase, partial [Bacilli bacterium]|nr:glycine--tRNA ligase [Bacilli bacterium]